MNLKLFQKRKVEAKQSKTKGKANMEVPQKIKRNYHTTQQSHLRVYIDPRELRAGAGTDAWTPCPQHRCSQQLKGGTDPNAHRQMSGRTTWSIQTVGCYSALKRKEIPTPSAWMNLEDVTLSEMIQTRKDDSYDSPCRRSLEESRSCDRKWTVWTGAGEGGGRLIT